MSADASHRLVSVALALLLHLALLSAVILVQRSSPSLPRSIKEIPVQLLHIRPDPLPAARAERVSASARVPRALRPAVARPQRNARAVEARRVTAAPADPHAPTQLPDEALRVERAPSELQAVDRREVEAVGAVRSRVSEGAVSEEIAPATGAIASVPGTDRARASAQRVAPSDFDAGLGVAAGEPATALDLDLNTGTGSLLREGVITGRDVIGMEDAPPLPDTYSSSSGVLLATGGPDAQGSGVAGGETGCTSRAEVHSYIEMIEARVDPHLGTVEINAVKIVKIRLWLDPAGSIQSLEYFSSEHPGLGERTVAAFHAAAPFPPMPEPVRCFAEAPRNLSYRIHPPE